MMNEKLLVNYQSEILDLFKTYYKKLSAKDLTLEFKTVLLETLRELGIDHFEKEEVRFLEEWFEKVHHQSFLTHFVKLSGINEVIFHSHQKVQVIYPESKTIIELCDLSADDYQLSFEIFAQKHAVAWNFSEPFASFSSRIDGHDYRVTLIHFSTTSNKVSKIFIRAQQHELPTLELFKNESAAQKEFIKTLIVEKKNILISGSTGSGKTTFMRALLSAVAKDEHVIILEDTHEIIPCSANQTSMLSHAEMGKKTLKDYCAYAMRMSPDRMIIGEMRSTEVVPFMLAMNTGHKGLMSTIHANSAVDALSRIALLFSLYSENKELDFALITKLVCKNIDYVIHMENKQIKEIARVIGSEGETPFYEIVFSLENN